MGSGEWGWEIPVDFALVAAKRPISVNRKNSRPGRHASAQFTADLKEIAATYSSNQRMLAGDLYARIIWFHRHQTGDPDNIIKPILDALQGVFYPDDDLIVKISCERFDYVTQEARLAATTTRPTLYDDLLDLLFANHDHILYIEVGEMPFREVHFGPIQ